MQTGSVNLSRSHVHLKFSVIILIEVRFKVLSDFSNKKNLITTIRVRFSH